MKVTVVSRETESQPPQERSKKRGFLEEFFRSPTKGMYLGAPVRLFESVGTE